MIDDPEGQALFEAEARQLTESLEAGLLALRSATGDRALIDGVFRDLHTLKGTGGMFGHAALAAFLHDFETAFEAVRDGSLEVSGPLIELSLKAHDHVLSLLAGGSPEPGEQLLADLGALRRAGTAAAEGAAPRRIRIRFAPDTLSLGGVPGIVLDGLRELGATAIRPLIGDLPPPAALDPAELHIAWEAELPAGIGDAELAEVFLFHEEALEILADPAPGAAQPPAEETGAAPPSAAEAAAGPPRPRDGAMMRVSAERLDEMMDRVGELVIAEARLADLAARSGDPQLVAVAEEIQRLATGMRDTTMSIRMTPIASIIGRFRRLVHDLSQALGKEIELRVEGEETELDKTVIEMLADPIMHLMRNAADHGLESAEERRAMGKPGTGTITVRAQYSGAEVLISLIDDGRGLDAARIRARGIERGLIGPEEELAQGDLLKLILEPGFSTAAQVTELSGRGVGMDVVKRTIEQLRGSIEISSEPGHGAAIHLRLPLTLAIIDGLLVEVAGERYTIPLAAVEHIIELPAEKAEAGAAPQLLNIRGKLVPFLRLRQLFRSDGAAGPHQKVVVVMSGELRVGLTVDQIIGSSQTVIKQLSPLHATQKTFSGATILGDGTVALILDVPQLVAFGQAREEREAA
ncbi:chemotaxis protein CheA [Poseidonocella sp. HB161398]|uniref:chemotaxis protein CheA n=1 Tax=Poseidonocella sp. HB161398 TaxID=2320855 RepID=UPI0011098677|nr:chemotaxis protein CheA [Poseidonocella sp. HB161398]